MVMDEPRNTVIPYMTIKHNQDLVIFFDLDIENDFFFLFIEHIEYNKSNYQYDKSNWYVIVTTIFPWNYYCLYEFIRVEK